MSEYAELHCHSSFSLLDGASNPEELIEQAMHLGLAALALTDHDDLGGAVRFAHAASAVKFPAIIGTELTLSGDKHIILLAQDLTGYKNICHLITKGRMKNERGVPSVTIDDLSEHAQGVVALSGCPQGFVPSLIAKEDIVGAREAALALRDIYKDNFFLELWNHNIASESIICRELIAMSQDLSIPPVATNNAHYAAAEKHIIHDVLTCLRHNVTLSTAGRRLRPNNSWHLQSPKYMVNKWRHYPDAIKNTLEILDRCQFRLGILKPKLPSLDLERRLPAGFLKNCVPEDVIQEEKVTPKEVTEVTEVTEATEATEVTEETNKEKTFSEPAGSRRSNERRSRSDDEILTALAWEGAEERYKERLDEKHRKQIQHELDLIAKLELAPYFLIMWDIIMFATSRGIAVQGRGSAANSAVCYCLKITAVDPIGADLLFERFIAENRSEPPDIDLDIAHQEREHVLQYVYNKYGREHAAMVCEHITYRGPSAVRDTARIFDFSPEQATALAAQADYHEAAEAALALASGGAQRAGLDPSDKKVQLLIQVVAGLHQLPRHRSIHVGGFVLSGEPLGRIVPVEPASMEGRTVIQWDKDDVDLAGLVKIDLLGLGMLTMLQEAVKHIKTQRNIDLDFSQLDTTDPAIYQMMERADTMGVFQVESRAQMSILPKLHPRCFYDIVVSIALVRPGPIQGNIVHPYVRRRRGLEPVTYLHPSIEPILKRTLGVPLFQEQGMRLAVVAAGFTASQADELRRVMSHKRSMEKMIKLCEALAQGMKVNGFSQEAIDTITFQLKAFANYGFPESHAASFALLVYASAYIKYYYAPEFYCAILNAQPMGFYSPATLIRDAMRHNVEVRSPDLAKSLWDCTFEKGKGKESALRIGLRFVDGLGPKAKAALQAAWQEGGPFTSIEDVCARSGLSAKDLERLAAGGAFQTFHPDRRSVMWTVLKLAKKRSLPLLDLLEKNNKEKAPVPPMNTFEQTAADYSILGLSCGKHPMEYYRNWANKKGFVTCADLLKRSHGERLTVAGNVICRQRPYTAKGFVFLTLEDETGCANIIVRPQIFEKQKRTIVSNTFMSITGTLQLEDGAVNIIAIKAEAIPTSNPVPMASRNFH